MEERVDTVEISLENGAGTARIRYYMVPDEFDAGDGSRTDIYSIRLEMTRDGSTTETVVRGLTPSAEKCRSVIRMLARGAVTPVTLRDVLEDLAANGLEPMGPRVSLQAAG